MIDFDTAIDVIAKNIASIGVEMVSLELAAFRVLAQTVHAGVASPRRDVSAMDGFAVRDVDADVGRPFEIVGQSHAGGVLPPAIGPHQTVRIFTGAALPKGADRVIVQESCVFEANGSRMTISKAYGPGKHIRRKASDFDEGAILLGAGTRLTARAMVTLAAADISSVAVYRQPQVALIATGDELVAPGKAVHGQTKIPESISFGLKAMICQHGGVITGKYCAEDSLELLASIAAEAIGSADLVVVTGGASVGDRDFAKPMFEALGLELLFTKVAIKPGKPVWLGRAKGCWVLGLPGNPTSAMVTARLFLVPILGLLQGQQIADVLDWKLLPSTGSFPAADDRTTFCCAGWRGQGLAPVGSGDSGVQSTLAASEWLVKQRANSSMAGPGSQVQAIRF